MILYLHGFRSSPNPLLVMEDVNCGYHTEQGDKTIVRGVTFSLVQGQRIGLLGVNGAATRPREP